VHSQGFDKQLYRLDQKTKLRPLRLTAHSYKTLETICLISEHFNDVLF